MDAVTIGFICYLAMILIVGIYTARLTKNIKDFALGSQRLGPAVIAFSERASGESAWLILGLPGAALVAGMLEIWTVVGSVGGIIFSWLIVAYPMRQETKNIMLSHFQNIWKKDLRITAGSFVCYHHLLSPSFSLFILLLNSVEPERFYMLPLV